MPRYDMEEHLLQVNELITNKVMYLFIWNTRHADGKWLQLSPNICDTRGNQLLTASKTFYDTPAENPNIHFENPPV